MIQKNMLSFKVHYMAYAVLLLSIFCGMYIETLTVFSVALIHELAHSFAAGVFGAKKMEIEILPFGAVLKIEEKVLPFSSMWISVSGPLANVLMVYIGYLIMPIFDVSFFIKINMLMFLLNMLPIVPLDGGEMIKSMLLLKYKKYVALKIMKYIGIIALVFLFYFWCYLLYSKMFNFMLLVIIVFLVYNAITEGERRKLTIMRDAACKFLEHGVK